METNGREYATGLRLTNTEQVGSWQIELPRTETRVRRTRKGRSVLVPAKYRPQHKRTVGDTHYVDPSADMTATVLPCHHQGRGDHASDCQCNYSEQSLIKWADTFLVSHCPDEDHALIGDRITHPDVTYADRGGVGQVTEWTYTRPPQFGPECETYRHATNPGTGALIVSNGDQGAFFGLHGLENAANVRTNDSHLSWPVRDEIPAANRLHTVAQIRSNGLAVLATDVLVTNPRGSHTVRRIIGRRMADRTALVSFSERGWFVGTEHVARASKRDERTEARRAERANEQSMARHTRRLATMADAPASAVRIIGPTVGTASATQPAVDAGDPLGIIREMAVGETRHGITRTAQGRWASGTTVYPSPGRAAMALAKAVAREASTV